MSDDPARPDPAAIYAARRSEREATRRAASDRDGRFSRARGVVFVAGLVVWWLVAGVRLLPPWTLGLAVGVFLALVIAHARTSARRRAAERAVAFYDDGLRRLRADFAGHGNPGTRFLDEQHPYAGDLDLFGVGSLFERLCRARTPFGEQVLAGWLLAPASLELARARQQALLELRPALDLRERLALAGETVGAAARSAAIVGWAQAAPVGFPFATRPVLVALAAFNLAALAAYFSEAIGGAAFLIALAMGGCVGLALRARVSLVLAGVDRPARDLALLAELLHLVESQPFQAPALTELARRLRIEDRSASQQVTRLSRLMDLVESRRNQLLAPFCALVFWSSQLALEIERWRAACGPRLGDWLQALGEFEALASLSGYAFEHPGDPFAELLEGAPVFEAHGLAHPLLPEERGVRNDVHLGGDLCLLLISGSNMSGKSTFLRSVGTNLVLAWAGAPVRAERLRVSQLTLGASICVHDSLLEGASRFYAEIRRLRQLMDLAENRPPLLFLLDEVLHGTNSSDRRVGAEALVRGLLERGALGLVTTHDLALAQVAEALRPRAANVHFEDHIEEGRIAFDYRMRPGVVTRSNAVALMRAVGLPV